LLDDFSPGRRGLLGFHVQKNSPAQADRLVIVNLCETIYHCDAKIFTWVTLTAYLVYIFSNPCRCSSSMMWVYSPVALVEFCPN